MMKQLEAPPTSAFSALLQGLIKPSLISLIVTCIAVITLIGTFLSFSKPAFIANHAETLADYNGDDDMHITSTVLKLQLEKSPPPSVYMIGDSALREVILEDDLAFQLKQSPQNLRIIELFSNAQTLLESLAIIDNIRDDAHGLIVLGVSPRGLTLSKSDYISAASGERRGFTSTALTEFLLKKGHESYRVTSIHGLDNLNFLLPRYVKHILTIDKKKIERENHRFKTSDPMSPEKLAISAKRYLKYISKSKTKYDSKASSGIAVLNTISETIRQKKYLKLLLVEKPLNPNFTHTYLEQSFINFHRGLLEKLTNQTGADYLVPTDSFEYDPLDFADLVHVTGGSTSKQYTNLLTQTILKEYK